MAFTYYNNSFMCRCNRTTKLYAKPTDVVPTIARVLTKGTTFISDRSVLTGRMMLYQISSSVNGNNDMPIGYWCPQEVLDMFPIENEVPVEQEPVQADDSTSISDRLFVKVKQITLYKTKDSTTPIQLEFIPGKFISVDRKIRVNCNGEMQTRFQISDIGTDDSVYNGYWILYNGGLQLESTIPKPTISVMARVGTNTSTSADDTTSEDVAAEQNNTANNENITIDENMRLDDLQAQVEDLYSEYGVDYQSTDDLNSAVQSSPIGRMTFVHGMPFQWNYIADRRRADSSYYTGTDNDADSTVDPVKGSSKDTYGHAFARNIAANMPIMVLVPGVPKYLTKANSGLAGGGGSTSTNRGLGAAFDALWQGMLTSTETGGAINEITDRAGTYDYFSFQLDLTTYHYYVNALCQTTASLMGLGKFKFRGKDCNKFDWKDYNTNAANDYSMFEEVAGLDGGVSFAYDPMSSISDTISNSTGDSQFASQLNQWSSQARELQFIVGQSGMEKMDLFGLGDNNASIDSVMNAADNKGNLLERVKDFFMNTAEGFNIRFPEIWQDSTHSRSYDVDMHFITPYATAFCKWRYVLVPFFHLFAMAAPQAPETMSVYQRPFIIKAFSKGYFNVELGIIESLTWRRFGDGDMISSDGVPTQIDVQVSFKDLYHVLTASHTNGANAIAAFFSNTGLMDMIGTLSGVNMNRVDLTERIQLYLSASSNALLGLGDNFMSHIQDRVANFLQRHWFLGNGA